MIDCVMLALIKKYAGSGGGSVSPEQIAEAVEKYMEEHPAIIEAITVNGETQEIINGIVNLIIPEIDAIPEDYIRGLF